MIIQLTVQYNINKMLSSGHTI